MNCKDCKKIIPKSNYAIRCFDCFIKRKETLPLCDTCGLYKVSTSWSKQCNSCYSATKLENQPCLFEK